MTALPVPTNANAAATGVARRIKTAIANQPNVLAEQRDVAAEGCVAACTDVRTRQRRAVFADDTNVAALGTAGPIRAQRCVGSQRDVIRRRQHNAPLRIGADTVRTDQPRVLDRSRKHSHRTLLRNQLP